MKTFAFLATTLALQVAYGATSDGPRFQCQDLGNLITAQAMSSSRSFSLDRVNTAGGMGLLTLWVQLTDANTSITRFDGTCTVSDDGNVTDYTPQDCTSGATCTSTDAGVWQKASPGTKKWPWRLDVNGFPDIECTFSVGTGAATAVSDVITVKGRLCTD